MQSDHLHIAESLDLSEAVRDRRLRFVTTASFFLSLLLIAMSLGGLTGSSTYARETANWTAQAIAQDWFDLLIAVPVLAAANAWAARGSRRSLFVLGGLLLFTVYTAAIYAFAVHLNVLFLVYCATLGLALFALIVLGRVLLAGDPSTWFVTRVPRRAAGGFLIGVGVTFTALWLAQLIPAALSGRPPAELAATGLATNPVHVLDLSFILPLHIIAGVSLLRRRRLGFVLAPVVLAFGAAMSASICFLASMTAIMAPSPGGTAVAIAMGAVAITSTVLLVRMLRAMRE